MRYVDAGNEETERILKKIESRIDAEYRQAEKEIQAKLDEFLRKFEIKDELKHRALTAGEITEREYKQWRVGQIMMSQRWAEMRDTIAADLTHAAQIARSTAFGYVPDVYAINHNYGTYQVEHAGLVDTSYTLYDRQTVERLMLDEDGRFIPKPGRVLSARINAGKTEAWNKKNVQSVMLQGILQGESVPHLATRLANAVGEQNRKVAIRNARTLVTGVQNGGRIDSYERANNMGIQVQKQWVATLDMRTRHSHRELDGVCVDYDKPFENEDGEIMYPGDPEADPANIFNCRCTMIASIAGFEHDLSNLATRNVEKLGDMSYEEWKEEHETYSESILRQDEIAETMQHVYGAEYAHYATLPAASYEGLKEDYPVLRDSDDVVSVNPSESNENCTGCAVAVEARCRGYDAVAKAEPVEELRRDPSLAWVNPEVIFAKTADKFREIDNAIFAMGEGARVQIDILTDIELEDGTFLGHSINAVVRGGVKYIDGQKEGSMYLDNVKEKLATADTVSYYRIDNLEISELGMKSIERRER